MCGERAVAAGWIGDRIEQLKEREEKRLLKK